MNNLILLENFNEYLITENLLDIHSDRIFKYIDNLKNSKNKIDENTVKKLRIEIQNKLTDIGLNIKKLLNDFKKNFIELILKDLSKNNTLKNNAKILIKNIYEFAKNFLLNNIKTIPLTEQIIVYVIVFLLAIILSKEIIVILKIYNLEPWLMTTIKWTTILSFRFFITHIINNQLKQLNTAKTVKV